MVKRLRTTGLVDTGSVPDADSKFQNKIATGLKINHNPHASVPDTKAMNVTSLNECKSI